MNSVTRVNIGHNDNEVAIDVHAKI